MGKFSLRWTNAGGLPWGLSFGMTQTLEGHVAFWGYRQWFLCELKTRHCGWPITDPPCLNMHTRARKKWAETISFLSYSAFEEKGCNSAFCFLQGQTHMGRSPRKTDSGPAVSDVSPPLLCLVCGRHSDISWMNKPLWTVPLSSLSVSLTRTRLPCRCLQEFLLSPPATVCVNSHCILLFL